MQEKASKPLKKGPLQKSGGICPTSRAVVDQKPCIGLDDVATPVRSSQRTSAQNEDGMRALFARSYSSSTRFLKVPLPLASQGQGCSA